MNYRTGHHHCENCGVVWTEPEPLTKDTPCFYCGPVKWIYTSRAQLNTETKTFLREEEKNKSPLYVALSNIHHTSNAVEAILKDSELLVGAKYQFMQDLRTYGMFKALIFLEAYEAEQQWKPGTFCMLADHLENLIRYPKVDLI